jgi:RNase P subunit RPR2
VQTFDAVKSFCNDCQSQLVAFNAFRAKCIRSDALLKEKVDSKPDNDEIKFENVQIDELDHEEASNARSTFEEVKAQPKKPCNEFVLENGIKRYLCRKCGKKFIMPGPLLKHEKKHEQKSLVFCELCGLRLSSARALKVKTKIFFC